MPTTRRSRVVTGRPEQVWKLVADPHHLPRWWPKAQRVESVTRDGWTLVLGAKSGKGVRCDYALLVSEPPHRRAWRQEIAGSPFERILREAVTEVVVEPANGDGGAARVTLVLRQRMRGLARLGGFLVRRATGRILDEALDGLEDAGVR
jgi:uncharacterized protein YndB with AHSA1/START domain